MAARAALGLVQVPKEPCMSVQIMDVSGDTRHEFDAFDAELVARFEGATNA